MKIKAIDLKTGVRCEWEGDLYVCTDYLHRTPGKGAAVVVVKLKNLKTGRVLEKTFRSMEQVERITIETRKMQYLYKDDTGYVFMDTETYDQLAVAGPVVEDVAHYMKPDAEVEIGFYNGEPISVSVGNFVELKVTDAPPGLKGDTATGATKPVTFETGLTLQVPLFIKEGDVLRIDTRTGEYITRV